MALLALLSRVNSATCFLRSNISSCVCFIFWERSWYLDTTDIIPIESPVIISPGRPPIADQRVAPRAFIPPPTILMAAIPDVAKLLHPFLKDKPRIVTKSRIICMLRVLCPICCCTMFLYCLYCSAVICPDIRSLLRSCNVNALEAARALRSSLVILFLVTRILCSIAESS